MLGKGVVRMITTGLLFLLNDWLQRNGITDVRVGVSNSKEYGQLYGLYRKDKNGKKRRTFIFKAKEFDDMVDMIASHYQITPDKYVS